MTTKDQETCEYCHEYKYKFWGRIIDDKDLFDYLFDDLSDDYFNKKINWVGKPLPAKEYYSGTQEDDETDGGWLLCVNGQTLLCTDTDYAPVFVKIRYCPMCGRELKQNKNYIDS